MAIAVLASLAYGGTITEDKLLASDAAGGAFYGRAVSVSGETLIVGAPQDGQGGPGAVYVLVRVGSTWAEQAILTASDAAPGREFGRWVALDGDTAVAGARYADGVRPWAGAAYVFQRQGSTWSEVAKLTASDGETDDWFGLAVGVSGETVVVGATNDVIGSVMTGSAYVFVDSGDGWVQQAKLVASDPGDGHWFGFPADIDGDTALLGAHRDDDLGPGSGSAYIFVRSGTVWTQQAKLLPTDGAAGDWFGHRAAIDGDNVVVGARYGDGQQQDSGTAYVFSRTGESWSQVAELMAMDGTSGDWFSESVAISHETVAVGAIFADGAAAGTGAAYVFRPSGATWVQDQKLEASDGLAGDEFGIHVSIREETIAVGAHFDDDVGGNAGSAYVFELPPAPIVSSCYADVASAACPCGNQGLPGHGCDTQLATGGVALSLGPHEPDGNGGGSAVLVGQGFPPAAFPTVVAIRSADRQNGGLGAVFGDGLLCVAPPVTRLGSGTAGLGTVALAIDHGAGPGTFHYQLWYRSQPAAFCDPAAAFNLSNGLSVSWQ